MKLQDFLTEYGAMVQLDKLWSKPVGSQQHLLKKSKKKKKTETKEAPKGTYFTKTGNLVKARTIIRFLIPGSNIYKTTTAKSKHNLVMFI